MENIAQHVNETGAEVLEDLTTETQAKSFGSATPVLATPAAVAAGVTAGAALGVAGFAAEETAEG